MNRLSHYNKELAVVLSVFGSSEPTAMQEYKNFFDEIKENLKDDIELRLAISSRSVLKKLESKSGEYYTLTEQLANLDRLGYRRVVVTSVNVFPTEEHRYLERIVDAFRDISDRYNVTMPLFARTKYTDEYLKYLNDEIRANNKNATVVFIGHGAPILGSQGCNVFPYIKDYLKCLNPANLFCTLEGPYPYNKEILISKIKNEKMPEDIIVLPLLLIAGVHSKNDIQEIVNDLQQEFKSVQLPNNDRDFCLLKLEKTRKYFIEEIQNGIEWLIMK